MDTSDSPTSKKLNIAPLAANATQSQIAQKTWEMSNSIQGLYLFNFLYFLFVCKKRVSYFNSKLNRPNQK